MSVYSSASSNSAFHLGFTQLLYSLIETFCREYLGPSLKKHQFRDVRAKSAPDDTAEATSKRLGHASTAITEKVYRRKAERVKPLR